MTENEFEELTRHFGANNKKIDATLSKADITIAISISVTLFMLFLGVLS